ncbi:MAG: hypothetical protein RLZZ24_961, partial [Pseudomonadota bacterium]
ETAWAESDVAQDDVIAAPSLAETEAEAADAIADAVSAASTTLGIDEHELARREAEQYQLGLAEGERIAHERMSQEIAAQRTVLESVTQQLHALLQSPQQFFEPLKRLAVHVAEQVVLGELQTSSQTIERVIARCLDELNHPVQGMVVIELHPQDKARLLETAPELVRGMRIDANETMTPGSVRLFANDAIVEDLVTQRLHALVQGLHLDDQAWQSHSLLQQPQWSAPKDMQPTHASPQAPAIADSSESDDVHP